MESGGECSGCRARGRWWPRLRRGPRARSRANQPEYLIATRFHIFDRNERLQAETQQRFGVRGANVEVPIVEVDADAIESADLCALRLVDHDDLFKLCFRIIDFGVDLTGDEVLRLQLGQHLAQRPLDPHGYQAPVQTTDAPKELEGLEVTDQRGVVLPMQSALVDENGKEFEQRIYINDVNPSNATVVEMRALEAHYKVEKQGGFTSLPLEAGNMGLNDRRDFISMFKKSIEDLNKLGRFDLSLLWTKSMDTYLNLPNANSKYK